MTPRLQLLGQIRGVDATTARCNFRRFPLPVSGMRGPMSLRRRTVLCVLALVALACLAAGFALGCVTSARAALPGSNSGSTPCVASAKEGQLP